jgi:hypothetical protein
MGGICGKHGKDDRKIYRESRMKRPLGVDWRITLKVGLKKWSLGVWTGLNWFWVFSNVRML